MLIQICVGSSAEIVELITKAIEENKLEDEVTLTGSFCIGECNRLGVTVQIDEKVHTGITRENFSDFFRDNVLDVLKN